MSAPQASTASSERPCINTVVATDRWVPPTAPTNDEVGESASAETAEDKTEQEPTDDENHFKALYLVYPYDGVNLIGGDTIPAPTDMKDSLNTEYTAKNIRGPNYYIYPRVLVPPGNRACTDGVRRCIDDFTKTFMTKIPEHSRNVWNQEVNDMASYFSEGEKVATQLGSLTKTMISTRPEKDHEWIQKQHDSSCHKNCFKIKFAKNREEFLTTAPLPSQIDLAGLEPDFDSQAHQRGLDRVWGDFVVGKGNAFVDPGTKNVVVPIMPTS